MRVASSGGTGFHTPGHNGGTGLAMCLQDWSVLARLDLSELEGLDNLHHPTGPIAAAQALAASAWGAERSWFLVNGSTVGLHAMLLATVGPGDAILLPRNCHQSVVHALVLSGGRPVFVRPEWDEDHQLAHGIALADIEAALDRDPAIKAVLLNHPTYFGTTGRTREIAEAVHRRGLPLLVDAAHGAHFRFHPDLPECAVACGADLVVHSAHKTLPAFTQAALLHHQGSLVDSTRVERALAILQSTSPSYLLMLSLDCARAQMETHGRALLERTLAHARRLRNTVPFPCLSAPAEYWDPTRLVIDVRPRGWTGYTAEAWLLERGIRPELATREQLVFILNTAHTEADIARLEEALTALFAAGGKAVLPCDTGLPALPCFRYTPREAFERPCRSIPLLQAVGFVSAQTVSAYPPGIAVLFPGEQVSAEAVAYLQMVLASGGELVGPDDREQIAVLLE